MEYSYNSIGIDYKLKDAISEHQIRMLILGITVDKLYALTHRWSCIPPLEAEAKHFFCTHDVIWLWNERKEVNAVLDSFYIRDGSIYWNGDSESVCTNIFIFAAWRTFVEFGVDRTFICKDITHWEEETTCIVSEVNQDGIQVFL